MTTQKDSNIINIASHGYKFSCTKENMDNFPEAERQALTTYFTGAIGEKNPQYDTVDCSSCSHIFRNSASVKAITEAISENPYIINVVFPSGFAEKNPQAAQTIETACKNKIALTF